MANIKKSFNFRNGVQVDDDNLKVSATGLVGIGTTVPTESLDVRGNLVVSGVSSAVTAQAGVMTVTTLNPTEIIGAGVSIVSGIVTASSGIITFYGDARFLQGMPTSQWEDTNTGLGVSSIYNTGGTVGIATTNPVFTFQVGNDPNSGQSGVGIGSFGDIKVSGVITATTFSGALTGNVTGNVIGDVTGNITGNITGDLTGNTQGIHTGAVNLGDNVKAIFGDSGDLEIFHDTNNSKIKDTGSGTLDILSSGVNIKNAGDTVDIAKFDGGVGQVQLFYNNSKKFSTSGVGVTITSQLDTTNLKVAGVSTFSGRIEGAATNNVIPFLYGNQGDLPSASSYHGAVAHVHATGALYFAHAGAWWELVNKESDGRVGTGTETFNVANINSSGIITATTKLNSPLIGVGTDTPANDIQVRKSGNTEIQVTSDSGIAGITVGRESGTGNTNNAELRYGGGAGANYSSAQSLDILNYGTGNFNYHLSANNAGAVAGNFYWHKGLNNERMMTLTNTGLLGIGLTTPTTPLHVLGAATISGSLSVGNNLTVLGSLNSDVSGNVTGNLTGNVNGNANAAAGISTFNNLSVAGISTFTSAKINTTLGIGLNASEPFSVNSNINNRVFVSASGNVGIKTTNTDGNTLLVAGSIVGSIIGAGTTIPLSTVDFSLAGQGLTGSFANKMFMIPPKVTNAQRGNLTGLVSGAMIYNTNLNKLQVYNGSAWETVTSS